MVVPQQHSTHAPDHAQRRDREPFGDVGKNGPGEPAPPGTRRPLGQTPALSNPSWLVLLLSLHYTATCHLLSTSSLLVFAAYARLLVFARLSPPQSPSLCSQAHTFSHKLSKEFFNRLRRFLRQLIRNAVTQLSSQNLVPRQC